MAGLKPVLIWATLRGTEAPLFHGSVGGPLRMRGYSQDQEQRQGPIEGSVLSTRVGIFRLRMPVRHAHRYASLKMTNTIERRALLFCGALRKCDGERRLACGYRLFIPLPSGAKHSKL
jgi:hypothetical protein